MRQIAEILTSMRQGFTEPVLCRTADGIRFVVKHPMGVTRRGLIHEWLAARIGQAMGLPIPEFDLLFLDKKKAKLMVAAEAESLAMCPDFGSCFIEPHDELTLTSVKQVAPILRADILLFDWWILNGDRNDGNSNLIWVAHEKSLYVIDHNLAFDLDLASADFWHHHIFRLDRRLWDVGFRRAKMVLMQDIINNLPTYWSEMPSEWTDEPCELSRNMVENFLRRFDSDLFWNEQ